MENNEKDIQEQKEPEKNRIANWDSSVIIALVAVLISLISVVFSYKETQIMKEQQDVLTSQQEASVWPYLYNSPYNDFLDDSIGIFKFEVVNKGVGPAILNDVTYTFDKIEIPNWGLREALKKKYPNLKIQQTQNWELSKTVLAPGDTHLVITVKITKSKKDKPSLNEVLNEIGELYALKYCYCSIYGKCWKVEGYNKTFSSTECEFREDIR